MPLKQNTFSPMEGALALPNEVGIVPLLTDSVCQYTTLQCFMTFYHQRLVDMITETKPT